MKRKTIKSGIILFCLLGGLYFYSTQSKSNVLNDLAFKNIEALALTEEDPNENFRCYGVGDIECHGEKVARKTTPLR